MIYQGAAAYPVKRVILHTAAVTPAWLKRFDTPEKQFAEIRRMHTEPGWQGSPNGWKREGYHYIVGINIHTGEAKVIRGRPETMIGAHVKEANRGSLGICMINIRTHQGITKFDDYFTDAQRREVKDLIADIARRTELLHVDGHNEYARKECPGFWVKDADWLPGTDNWWNRLLSWFMSVLKGE